MSNYTISIVESIDTTSSLNLLQTSTKSLLCQLVIIINIALTFLIAFGIYYLCKKKTINNNLDCYLMSDRDSKKRTKILSKFEYECDLTDEEKIQRDITKKNT